MNLVIGTLHLKGFPRTEALIRHDATIAARKERRLHIILLDAAATETPCATGAG